MIARYARQAGRWLVTALLIAVALTSGSLAQGPAFAPPEAVLGQSFSITAGSASTGNGIHPADIVGANGLVSISCVDLGLLCTDPESGDLDELAALSFGVDFNDEHLPAVQFSVSAGAVGAVGSAVAREVACAPGQAHADVFETALDNSNSQDLDGDGVACSSNAGLGLGLLEPPGADEADELDALAQDPCQAVDFDCNGIPDEAIYLVLGSGSPSLALFGATSADILVAREGALPEVWAAGVAELGLQNGDVIDALCLEEDGDGIFGEDDKVLFSLAPSSPSLAALGAGPGALLTSSPLLVLVQAPRLGLGANDNIDALACGALVQQIVDGDEWYFPFIGNNPISQ